ncbi:MAG: acetylornithine deacetylase [Gaiellales bacterium]|nr:acetylornithine deacetylase [Gaiellales bacterium]
MTGNVLEHVDEKALVELASDLIRIPSFKGNETPVAEWLAEYFSARGYVVDLQEVDPGRFQAIATLKGTGDGPSLMFNGHTDIDPLAYGWTGDPFTPRLEGNRLYGAGVWNMKGGVASMICAAEAVRRSGTKLKGDLVIACVVGELEGGVGTKALLDSGFRTDAAVVTEPVGAANVVTTHAGAMEMAVSTIGYSEHVTTREHPIDAIRKMMKVISALEHVKFRHQPRPDLPALPYLNVNCIIGGRGRDHDLQGAYFTSDYCTAIVDVRFLPGQTSETVVDDVRNVLDALQAEDPEFRYEIEVPPPPKFKALRVMEPTDVPTDADIVQSVVRHYEQVAGKPPNAIGTHLPPSYTVNDTCHLWRAGIPCVLYGPAGSPGTPAKPDNAIFIDEMVLATKVLALTALDFCEVTTE